MHVIQCAGSEFPTHNIPTVIILDLVMGSGRHNIARETKVWGISRLCGTLIVNAESGMEMYVEHPQPI